MRLAGNHFPHPQLHCGTRNQKTQQTKSISQVKYFFSRNDTNPLPFFYNGSRKAQIIHCKLHLGMSDLNYDQQNRHLTINISCDCRERKETSEHYILLCPRFTYVHHNKIFKVLAKFCLIFLPSCKGTQTYQTV